MIRSILALTFLALPLVAQDLPPAEAPDIELDNSRFMGEFIKMLLILGAMVGVLLAISWWVKRWNQASFEKANDTNIIKVIERRQLAPRVNVYLIEVEGRTVLVGETPHGLARLTEYPSQE